MWKTLMYSERRTFVIGIIIKFYIVY
jgi:hypothetical protein